VEGTGSRRMGWRSGLWARKSGVGGYCTGRNCVGGRRATGGGGRCVGGRGWRNYV